MQQKSAPQRLLWAQFDALQMGSGWDEEDIKKPQIMLEDVFGDSHPGSTHLAGLMEQAKYGVFEKGGYPAQYHTTDICDGCLFSVLGISNRRKNGLKWAFVSIELRKNTYFNCVFTPCFAPESDLQN